MKSSLQIARQFSKILIRSITESIYERTTIFADCAQNAAHPSKMNPKLKLIAYFLILFGLAPFQVFSLESSNNDYELFDEKNDGQSDTEYPAKLNTISQSNDDYELLDEKNDDHSDTEFPANLSTISQSNDLGLHDTDCMPDIQPYQGNIRHIESGGIGYKNGYTTLEFMFAPSIGSYIPFLDLRGHVFDNGKCAANVGVGTRYIINQRQSMIGINAYYDYRNTNHFHYNQAGLGLEGYFHRWELRINGYLPFGDKVKTYHSTLESISFEGFEGHNLLIFENYKQKNEFAMKGFNAEFGAHVFKPTRNWDLYISAGPYYFHGKYGNNAWGGKLRVNAQVWKYVIVEVSDSYDSVFHNKFQGQVAVTIPFGPRKYGFRSKNADASASLKNLCFSDNIMRYRGVQPVQRQEIVVVNKQKRTQIVDPVAIDAATNQPFYFVFVNNANTNAVPDGTFENPYPELSPLDGSNNAQDNSSAGNIIYVFSGNGSDANMDHGIILKNSQRFLGSGVSHQFNTTLGPVTVPAQTTNYPTISNMTSSLVISLAASTEASGFIVNQLLGTGTPGNEVINASSIASGNISVTRNIITAFNNSLRAIDLTTSSAGANLYVDSNTVLVGDGPGIEYKGPSTAVITNNVVLNGGIFTETFGSSTATADVLVSGNTLNTNALAMRSNGGHMDVRILNNLVQNVIGNAIVVNTTTSSASINVELSGNTVINSSSSGFLVQNDLLGSTMCARVVGNSSSPASGFGYSFVNASGALFNLEPLSGNTGSVSTTGTITNVPACSCGLCQ